MWAKIPKELRVKSAKFDDKGELGRFVGIKGGTLSIYL